MGQPFCRTVDVLKCKKSAVTVLYVYGLMLAFYLSFISVVMEGDMGVYGIAVLGFFSCGISVILILTRCIAVSSSSAVCGFSSFWLTVFGEIRLFTVLRYQ